MDTTYKLTAATREEFNEVQSKLIADFSEQFTGAEVTNTLLGTGRIVSCFATAGSFDSVAFTVYFDLDETKHYLAATALSSGGLKFVDDTMTELYAAFAATSAELKHQLYVAETKANEEAKAAAKKAEQKKKADERKQAKKDKPEPATPEDEPSTDELYGIKED